MLRRADGPWVYYPLDGRRVIAEQRGWANMTRNLNWRVVGVDDFNDDGRDDALARRTDGAWVYYPVNGRRVVVEERGWANPPRDVDWRMAGTGDSTGMAGTTLCCATLTGLGGTARWPGGAYSLFSGRRRVYRLSWTGILPASAISTAMGGTTSC